MKYTISNDRKTLTIEIDKSERESLVNESALLKGESIHSDSAMFDFLEPVICNSELEWINPATTGDLTSAPMLGILQWPDDNCDGLPEVTERWAFMDYQIRSVLEDLRDNGKAVFVS